MPGTKKIRLVPNFVVDIGNVFFDRVTTGGGLDHLVPLVPVFGFSGIFLIFYHVAGGVGKRKEGSGAGFYDATNNRVEAGKVKIVGALVNLIEVKKVVDSDVLGSNGFDLGDNRGKHVDRFFASLGEVLPEVLGQKAVDFLSVDDDVGIKNSGFFAGVNNFFETKKKEGEKEKEKDGF